MNKLKNLKKARKNMNLTQKDLSNLILVSKQSIYNYENGEREPDLDTLINLSEKLNVSIQYLLGMEELNENERLNKKLKTLTKEQLIEIILKFIKTIDEIKKI